MAIGILTAPVISFYQGPNYLESDASQTPDAIFAEIRQALDRVAQRDAAAGAPAAVKG